MAKQPLTTCVFVSVCVKVHKPKYSALGPAAYRSMDVILALADYLLMVGYGVYDKTEPCWILPDLKSTSQPGAKLGAQMKALLLKDRGGAVGYQHVAVKSLSYDVAGAGLRHGAVDHLQTEAPIEINLHGTGQTSRAQESTFRENYAGADKGACSTVSRILGGFPAPLWGTMSAGPKAPCLDCLREIGVDLEKLNVVLDEMYDIHSACNPLFHQGARLRPFIEACAATHFMYYSERVQLSSSSSSGSVIIEMRDVCLKLEKVVGEDYKVSYGGMAADGDVHLTLLMWSKHIRQNFDLMNLDIVSRIDISGSQLAAQNKVIQKFGDNVSVLNSGFTRLEQKMDKLLERLEARDQENMDLRRELENSELRNMRLELELLRSKTSDKSLTSPRNHGDARNKPLAPSSPSPSSPAVGTLLPVSSLSQLSLYLLSLYLAPVVPPLSLSRSLVLAPAHACLTISFHLSPSVPNTLSPLSLALLCVTITDCTCVFVLCVCERVNVCVCMRDR